MAIAATRDLFLLFMAVVYLVAFASLYVQIPGLYGDNGLLPARLVVGKEAKTWSDFFDGQPTLLKLTPRLGLDTQTAMDLICIAGILLSFLAVISYRFRDTLTFALLWMFYLSLYQVGQTFLWFQWDILLLEAGFLTILAAPFCFMFFHKGLPSHNHDYITLWLIKWLLFRLMFASGVVKLTSRCPTWWGLSALSFHFESQCIPTPLAWYWHQLPEWFLKLSVAATYVIEIPIPFLFFCPVRSLRLLAFYLQVLLQLLIIVTGNYNFFNLLTIALCIPLLDDEHLGKQESTATKSKKSKLLDIVGFFMVIGYIVFQTINLFSLKIESDFTISSKIAFTEKEFNEWLEFVLPITIWFGILSLVYEVFIAVLRSFIGNRSFFRRNLDAIQCLIFGILAAGMFSISLVPHTVLHRPTQKILFPAINEYHALSKPFSLTSSYGLFRRMTGVDGRPEVIIEGSMDNENWKAYEFIYKPGNTATMPPIVAPHQPRLDWQMWFAALGNYQHNPWFLNLIYRLFNNQAEVTQLIQHNPFSKKPPKYIRANLFTYHYTAPAKTGAASPTRWWTRTKKAEYLPTLTKDEKSFVQYLKHYKITENVQKKRANSALGQGVKWIRRKIRQPEGFSFVMSIFGSAALVSLVNKYILRI